MKLFSLLLITRTLLDKVQEKVVEKSGEPEQLSG